MKPKKKQSRTSWGRVARWYTGVVENPESYQQTLILPNLTRLLPIKKGERLLDLGCGTGYFSEYFARKGAEVVGLDISREFIAVAQERAQKEKLPIRYHIGSGDKLGMIADASMDTILILLAIQNMERYQAVFLECARVLKKSGRLILVMNHPVFRIPQNTEWGWDMEKRVQYRRIDTYLSDQRIAIQMHPGRSSREVTTSFHRSLQSLMAAFRATGLCIANLEEWISNKKSDSGPRAVLENRARNEFPLFMYIEARKL